jgi:hypothetical protein
MHSRCDKESRFEANGLDMLLEKSEGVSHFCLGEECGSMGIYFRVGFIDVLQEVQITLEDPFFQQKLQNNATIYIAGDTMAWFEENNIQVMKWSACSPDLNPIENC